MKICIVLILLTVSCSRPTADAQTVSTPSPGRVNVHDHGAIGDGVTNDTAAILRAIWSLSTSLSDDGRGGVVYFPRGRYIVTETLPVPPNVWLVGDSGSFSSRFSAQTCSAIDGSGFLGPVIRLMRVNTVAEGLFHRGGIKSIGIVGNFQGTLVELGDSRTVDQLHGAWNVTLRDLTLSNGAIGVLASHTQEALIEACVFRNISRPIVYPTVVASSRIIRNSFYLGSGVGPSVGIDLHRGIQGGSAGVVIEGNYFLGFDIGVSLNGISGAAIYANQLEGVGTGVQLTDSTGAWIEGNTWINWLDSAVALVDSTANRIGHGEYRSPNGAATAAVTSQGSIENRIDRPIIQNPQSVRDLVGTEGNYILFDSK